MGFTPDGTQLVVTASYVRAVHVWDLRAIRQRLKGMGLDWDWPEFPPAAANDAALAVVKIEVDPGHLAHPALTREQRARQEIDRCRREIEANPDSARACNNLAWVCLTAPEGLRDVAAAVPLAEKAVQLEPGNAVYGNTLGVARYRQGRYREAVEVLRPNLDKQEDKYLAFDLYFLAMSHHRLSETVRARDYYDWAVRWLGTQKGLSAGHLEELGLFHDEVSELLGVAAKGDLEIAPPPREVSK
jgi:tetratricopeptide (TPR) repeat protein